MELAETFTQVARKQYRCEWCGEAILKGEKHTKVSGLWDGRWSKYRLHFECEKAMGSDNDLAWFLKEEGFAPFSYKRGSIEEK